MGGSEEVRKGRSEEVRREGREKVRKGGTEECICRAEHGARRVVCSCAFSVGWLCAG